MKKGLKEFGVLIILVGLVFIVSSSLMGITGNVVNENNGIGNSILGILFIIGGIALFLSEKEGGLERISKKQKKAVIKLENWLETRNVGTVNELKKQIRKAGYTLEEGANHTKVVYGKNTIIYNKHPVTIPRHQGDLASGTYKNILRGVVEDIHERYY